MANRPDLTGQEIEAIVQARRNGTTWPEITDRYGFGVDLIRARVNDYLRERKRPLLETNRWTRRDFEKAVMMYEKGETPAAIGAAIGRKPQAVKNKLCSAGITRRDHFQTRKKAESRKPTRLREWPRVWSEMTRRQFCRLRSRGYGPVDVARMLRIDAELAERAWKLKEVDA